MGGKTRVAIRAALRLDLKDSGAVWSNAELDRCIERAVADLSRYLPREKLYEAVIRPTVTDESWTSPATTSLAAIVSAADINVSAPALLTIAGQPDKPRVLTLTITDANNSTYGVTFTIRGMDRDEVAQTEIFHYSRGDSKTIIGKKEFKYVYEVEMTSNAGSGAADTLSVGYGLFTAAWVSLTYKPIKKASETVENAAGTTTYARNTDYIMDYSNGKIQPKAGGSLAAATAYLISYTKDEVGIDLSALADFIRLQRVEYPVGDVPQSFVPASIFGRYLVIEGRGEADSQDTLGQHDHLRLYYDAEHQVPNDYTPGSIPEFLEPTIEMAATAYALLIYALKQDLAAETALTSMGTTLTSASDAHANLVTALTNIKKYLDNNTAADAAGVLALAALATVFTDTGTALTNSNKYLHNNTGVDAVGVLTSLTSVFTAVEDALTKSIKYLDNNSSVDAAGMLAGMGDDLTAVNTALNGLKKYLDNNSAADAAGLLAAITTDIVALRTAINTALDAANAYADAVAATDITDAKALLNSYMGTANYAAGASAPSIKKYLEDGDAFLNTVTLGGESERTPQTYAEFARASREIITAYENLRTTYGQEGQLRVNAAMAYATEAVQRLANLRTYIEQSQGYVAVAVGFFQNASAVIEKLNIYLQKSAQYQGISGNFLTECSQRLAKAAQYISESQDYIAISATFVRQAETYLAEADRYIAKAQGYVSIAAGFSREAEARIAEIAQYQAAASAYAEQASAYLLTADRYRTEATERRNEVFSIWQDRKQLIGDFTMGSVRQLPMSQRLT